MINEKEYSENFAEKVHTKIQNAYGNDFQGIVPTSASDPVSDADSGKDNDVKEIDAPPEAILLTEENCSACDFTKTALSADIEQGKIKVCDLADEECKAIGREINLQEVPAIVIEDEKGKLVQCEIGKDNENIVIQCPTMPNMEEPEAPKRPPKIGKIGISCVGWNLKNILMVEAKNLGGTQEDILKIHSLPECEGVELGFAPIKTGKGATDTKTSKRGAYMRSCLKDSSKGDTQPNRMRQCSKKYRELKEQGKIK